MYTCGCFKFQWFGLLCGYFILADHILILTPGWYLDSSVFATVVRNECVLIHKLMEELHFLYYNWKFINIFAIYWWHSQIISLEFALNFDANEYQEVTAKGNEKPLMWVVAVWQQTCENQIKCDWCVLHIPVDQENNPWHVNSNILLCHAEWRKVGN